MWAAWLAFTRTLPGSPLHTIFRGRGKSLHAPDRKSTFREVGLCPWNPERIRSWCQNNATGVTPDSLSDAADLLVHKMKKQDMTLAQRVKCSGSCLEEAPPSTIGTLCFPSFGGRTQNEKAAWLSEQPNSKRSVQRQNGAPRWSIQWSQARSGHAVMQAMRCAAIQLAAALISGPKSGSCGPRAQPSMHSHFFVTRSSHMQRAAEPEHKQHQNTPFFQIVHLLSN